MSNVATLPLKFGRSGSQAPFFDRFLIVPILLCAYTQIIEPLLLRIDTGPLVGGSWTAAQYAIVLAPRLDHKVFMGAMLAISVILVAGSWSRLTLPPHIICLFAFLAYAGASVLWAFKPEFSSLRFVQEAILITSVVLPTLLATRTADLMRCVFLCFALAVIVNFFFVLDQTPMIFGVQDGRVGYIGYFVFKGLLGECAAVAMLLALHETLYPGWRRIFGVIIIGLSIYLIFQSDSKGSLGIALLAPLLAGFTSLIRKKMRVSPAIVLLSLAAFYFGLSSLVGDLINRISWNMYGNYTLSGRTLIWDFVNYEIARAPLLGWGYGSFWLIGPDAPSIVEAPGWIKNMPCGHSGYLDTIVEMGYVGLVFLIIFILTTLRAIGQVVDRDPTRGWFLLSIAFYVILTNIIETAWMQGCNTLWLMFLFVAAETGRYCRYFPPCLSEPMRRGSNSEQSSTPARPAWHAPTRGGLGLNTRFKV